MVIVILTVVLVHADDRFGSDALVDASKKGDLLAAKRLLKSTNPNSHGDSGMTPLYAAVVFGRVDVMKLLLSAQADPNLEAIMPPRNAVTPLEEAAYIGNLAIIRLLLANGANVNGRDSRGQTALCFGIGHKSGIFETLIKAGADVSAPDDEGATVLNVAAGAGASEDVKVLLAHGAHLNAVRPQTGATPLNEAVCHRNPELVKILLAYGADLTIADKRGKTPLDNAINLESSNCLGLLLKAMGSPPRLAERSIEEIIRKGNPDMLAALLGAGLGMDTTVAAGSTLLVIASSLGLRKNVEFLLARGANPNLSGPDGATPLEVAALAGQTSILNLLLLHGAEVNHVNTDSGVTALYAAASFGRKDSAALLLRNAANANLCGTNGKTPLEVARANGYEDIAVLLQQHGGLSGCDKAAR